MAEVKTKQNKGSVDDFINKVADKQKREDSNVILEMMKKATGEEPMMWGASLIGFGNVKYTSPSTGKQSDWFQIGFSPRKTNFSIYLMNLPDQSESLKKLGKHKTGVGCLYINKLEDVDVKVLKKMIEHSAKRKII